MQRILVCALGTIGTLSCAVAAQSGGPYVVTEFAIAGGGATLGGGSFRLSGTIGESASTPLAASGYRLYAGFWVPATAPNDSIFANGFDP